MSCLVLFVTSDADALWDGSAGPRLTVALILKHMVNYNLQALAKHVHGCDYEYHTDIRLINDIATLYAQLSGLVQGSGMYAGWINADAYEACGEQQGILPFPCA